jgi:broad specificity phosphatase PhoE
MSDLVLVRHAMPAVDPHTSPSTWHLTPSGRQASRLLARSLPTDAFVVSSTEPKAVETAQEIQSVTGGAMLTDDRFVEVARPDAWLDDHRILARSYLTGQPHDGWEPHAEVASRFRGAVIQNLERADGQPLVVVTHGQAMTIWLAAEASLGDPAQFWAGLEFPDAWRLSATDGATLNEARLRRLARSRF